MKLASGFSRMVSSVFELFARSAPKSQLRVNKPLQQELVRSQRRNSPIYPPTVSQSEKPKENKESSSSGAKPLAESAQFGPYSV